MNIFENIDEKINRLLEEESQNVRKIVKDMRDDLILYFKDIQNIMNEKKTMYMKKFETGLYSQQEVTSLMDIHYKEFDRINKAFKLKRKNIFEEIKKNNDFILNVQDTFSFDIIINVKNITRKFQIRDKALEFKNGFQYEEETFIEKKINNDLIKIIFFNDEKNLNKISNIALQVSYNDNLSSLYINFLILENPQIETISSFGKYGTFYHEFESHDVELINIKNFDIMKLDTTEAEDLFSIFYDKKINLKNNHMYLSLKEALQELHENLNIEDKIKNIEKKTIKMLSK